MFLFSLVDWHYSDTPLTGVSYYVILILWTLNKKIQFHSGQSPSDYDMHIQFFKLTNMHWRRIAVTLLSTF